MRRRCPHPAKITGCRYQAPPEMPVPDAIDDRPPRQGIMGVGDPARQSRAAGRLVAVERDGKSRGQPLRRSSRFPGIGGLAGLMNIAAPEHVHRPWLARRDMAVVGEEVARTSEDQCRRRQRRQLGLQASAATPGLRGSIALISRLSRRLSRSMAGSGS